MKILIADDERLVRISLVSMIQELYGQDDIIEQARDGDEMIKMVRENPYDLIFLDINMPKRNGLDALELCREYSAETDWCVLSGYADFEYAKRAISLGVKGYLVKPLDIKELKRFMDEISCEKAKKRQNKHKLFENRISQAFALADTTGVMREISPASKGNEYSIYIFLLDVRENSQRQSIYGRLYKSLEEYLQNHIDEADQFALFFLQTSELCLLIEGKEYFRLQSFLQIHAKIYQEDAKMVAVYTRNTDFNEVYRDKQLLLALAPLHILENNLKAISLKEMSEQTDLMERRFFCEKIEILTSCYLTGNYGEANEVLQEIEKEEGLWNCYKEINHEPLLSHLSIVWGYKFEDCSFVNLLAQFRKIIEDSVSESRETNYNLIQQIKKYVSSNYMGDVSLATIGRQFEITPSYVSRIFQDKTGEKYIDFVTGIRMNKAKELLLNKTQMSVKEVAERVGYTSEKHFSKIFKKYFNCIPSKIGCE